MKKYIRTILATLSLASLGACSETVTMDGSVAQRVDAAIDEYMDELSGADYGWLLNVMSDEGIYRFWCEFGNDNTVTMFTDNLHYPELNGIPKTSTYNMRAMQRPTLSFDTYTYISLINDPDNSISGGSGNHGLNSDFELEVVDYDAEKGRFNLMGHVNKVAASMTKATREEAEAVMNGGLMDVLNNATNYNTGKHNAVNINGCACDLQISARKINITYLNSEEEAVLCTVNTYTNLDKSITFDTPAVINDTKIVGLDWDGSKFSVVTDDGATAVVEAADQAQVALHHLFGYKNVYEGMIAAPDMYTDSANPITGYLKSTADMYLTDTGGGKHFFANVTFEFDRDEDTGRIILVATAVFGRFSGPISFPVTYNEDMTEITLGAYTFVNQNAELFFGPQVSGLQALANTLANNTFKIEWSNASYPGYIMGQLVQKKNPRIIVLGGML